MRNDFFQSGRFGAAKIATTRHRCLRTTLYRFITYNVPKKWVHSENKNSTTEGISLLDTILNPKGS